MSRTARRDFPELDAIGDRRRAALATAEAELDRLVAVVPAAFEAGLTLRDVAAHAAASRTTLHARTDLRREPGRSSPAKDLTG